VSASTAEHPYPSSEAGESDPRPDPEQHPEKLPPGREEPDRKTPPDRQYRTGRPAGSGSRDALTHGTQLEPDARVPTPRTRRASAGPGTVAVHVVPPLA
jgi:hypothetical protein